MSNNQLSHSSRSNQGNRNNQNASRGQNRGNRRHTNNQHNTRSKYGRNTTFTPPEWAHKDLGSHVFIIGPNAPTKYHKTKLAIINHITKEMKNAEDIKWALKHEEEFDMEAEKPETKDNKGNELTIDTTTAAGLLLKLQLEQYLKRINIYKSNKTTAYGYIIGQCTQAMKNQLEAREDWTIIEDELIPTLKAIKEITHNYQQSKYYIGTVSKVIRDFFTIKQDDKEPTVQFAKRYRTQKELMEDRFGKINMEQAMKSTPEYTKLCDSDGNLLNKNKDKADQLFEASYQRLIGHNYIEASSLDKANQLSKELSNDYAMGDDKYPKDLDQAIDMLNRYRAPIPFDRNKNKRNRNTDNNNNNDRVAFTQVTPGLDGKTFNHITCNKCKKKGHYANQCPELRTNNTSNINATDDNNNNETNEEPSAEEEASQSGSIQQATQHTQISQWNLFNSAITAAACCLTFAQVMRDLLLLDNQSTDDIFCNDKYLKNIHHVKETLQLSTNGGVLTTNMKGTFPGYGLVWYHPNAITNILSQSRVEDLGYHITYQRGSYKVSGPKGHVIFKRIPEGLYALRLNKLINNQVSLVQTIEANKHGFSKRQILRAERALRLQETIMFPSIADYKNAIQMNAIKNCPVTIDDINILLKIYGTSIPSLKGKSTRRSPPAANTDYIELPPELEDNNRQIELAADLFYIQSIIFLLTLSKHIKFYTICHISDRTISSLCDAFDQTFRIYNAAGFTITHLHVDPEFEPLTDFMTDNDIKVILYPASQHVPDIERGIRFTKDRYRTVYHSLPYRSIPKQMIIALAKRVIKFINMFPPKGGVSKYYSPRAIITRLPLDYNMSCQHPFGSYVQANNHPDPTNTPAARTLDCIYLDSIGGPAGGHSLLHLPTNRVITRTTVHEVPLSKAALQRVETLAKRDKIPDKLSFILRHLGKFTTYSDDDDPLIAGVDDQQQSQQSETTTSSESESDDDSISSNELMELHNNISNNINTPTNNNDNNNPTIIDDEPEPRPQRQRKQPEIMNISTTTQQSYNNATIKECKRRIKKYQKHIDKITGVRRNNKKKKQIRFEDQLPPSTTNMEYETKEATVLANIAINLIQTYTLKQGIKKFGDDAKQAAFKEVKQLHDRSCFIPIHLDTLTKLERQRILRSLIFITEKRDGTKKGRACADGSTQRNWMTKEDTASPTVSLPSVLITSVIDAHEEREVAVVDIPNFYVQTPNQGDRVIMKISGELARLLVQVCPELYSQYLTEENGIPVLYVQVDRAIYGMLHSGMLAYKQLVKYLLANDFILNPYDPCVANKTVRGKQLTITWHVDDVKVSSEDKKAVDEFIQLIRDEYENYTKVNPSRGKIHDYLAMILDFNDRGKVKVKMEKYIEAMHNEFPYPEQIKNKTVTTPASENLFKINPNATKLDNQQADIFHTYTAKNLFLSQRSRLDIMLTVAFLCTRVRHPDEDDWKKLLRLLIYLHCTKHLFLTLEANNLSIVKWWADAAFAVHHDFKSHTGATMSFGKGAVQAISAKQKINTKSSTEAELVAADDTLSYLLQTKYFLEAQGYPSDQTILYQDNTSAILLERNGRSSSGKQTRHINIRYYFIKDRIDSGDLEVQHCPTNDLIADYMSKPLQGAKFYRFRKAILNLWTSFLGRRSRFLSFINSPFVQQECVGIYFIILIKLINQKIDRRTDHLKNIQNTATTVTTSPCQHTYSPVLPTGLYRTVTVAKSKSFSTF